MNEHLNVELFWDNKKVYLVPYMVWMLFVTFFDLLKHRLT